MASNRIPPAAESTIQSQLADAAGEMNISSGTGNKSTVDYPPGLEDAKVIRHGLTGSDLLGAQYENPFKGPHSLPVIHADFVSVSSGTGLVHVAPGHGFDDFIACQTLGISAEAPVDDQGCFTEAAFPARPETLKNTSVLHGGSKAILDLLAEFKSTSGEHMVWTRHNYTHKYPIDWRTKQPVLIRATYQWFAELDSVKQKALPALETVIFVPQSTRARLQSFIAGRSHWCISRQRAWGVPIPALYRQHDNESVEAVMTSESISHIINMIEKRGMDAWWTDPMDDPVWVDKSLPAGRYIRGKDTMDVWFDSGTTWTSLPNAFDDKSPADVYVEGSDQHRGWFQSSLLTHVVHQQTTPKSQPDNSKKPAPHAPFKTLITHGFILDHAGRKMSKSLGNVVSPNQIIDGSLLPPLKPKKGGKKQQQKSTTMSSPDASTANATATTAEQRDALGPDALRLWVAASDYTRDVQLGAPVLSAVHGMLHKYRLTLKWLLGVLQEYNDPFTTTFLPYIRMGALSLINISERAVINALNDFTNIAHLAYMNHEPFKVVNALNVFVNNDLSSEYFEAAKDTLYTGTRVDCAIAKAACYDVFRTLLVILAPVTPLLVEETLEHTPESLREALEKHEHIPYHSIWAPDRSDPHNPSITTSLVNLETPGDFTLRMACLRPIHSALKTAQEHARTQGKLGSGLDCEVIITQPSITRKNWFKGKLRVWLSIMALNGELARHFVVSGVKYLPARALQQQSRNILAREDFEIPAKEFKELAADEDAREHDDVRLGSVMVLKPPGEKCVRCWRWVVGSDYDRVRASRVKVKEPSLPADAFTGVKEAIGKGDKVCKRCKAALREVGALP